MGLVIGGEGKNQSGEKIPKSEVCIYNLKKNKWTYPCDKLNMPRCQTSGLMIGDRVYVFGGISPRGYEKKVEYIPLKGLLKSNLDLEWQVYNARNMVSCHSLVLSLQ